MLSIRRVPAYSVIRSASQARSVKVMATAATHVTVWVKGYPKEGRPLGDCPFCHRVLLTLEAKKLPYKIEPIDFDEKPQWLLDVNQGKVPVIKETPDGDYMPDSDKIVEHLEEKYPNPSMKAKAPAELGTKLMPNYRALIMGPDSERPAKLEALLAELKAIEHYLSQPGHGPLFGGSHIDATDAAVAPKLNNCVVALKHFRNWDLPAEFTAVHRYLDTIKAMPEWKHTDYGSDLIIKGWQRHLDGK